MVNFSNRNRFGDLRQSIMNYLVEVMNNSFNTKIANTNINSVAGLFYLAGLIVQLLDLRYDDTIRLNLITDFI